MDAVKERGVAAAALAPAEAAPQGDEEADSDDLASKTCTWPPPEAEYFFGEKRLHCRPVVQNVGPVFGHYVCVCV